MSQLVSRKSYKKSELPNMLLFPRNSWWNLKGRIGPGNNAIRSSITGSAY